MKLQRYEKIVEVKTLYDITTNKKDASKKLAPLQLMLQKILKA